MYGDVNIECLCRLMRSNALLIARHSLVQNGCSPGMSVKVQTPNGSMQTVQIPAGAKPGA